MEANSHGMDPIYCGFLHPQKAGWAWADFIASHPLENGLFINKTHCHYLKSGKEPLSQKKVLSHSCIIASFSLPGGPNTVVVHAYTTSHGKTIFFFFFGNKGRGTAKPLINIEAERVVSADASALASWEGYFNFPCCSDYLFFRWGQEKLTSQDSKMHFQHPLCGH